MWRGSREEAQKWSPAAKRFLENMIQTTESWLPSKLYEIGCFLSHPSTNMAEGVFGNYKQTHWYTMMSAGELCKGLRGYGQLLVSDSIRGRVGSNERYASFPLFEEAEISQIGKLALGFLAEELNAFTNGNDNAPWCIWCCLRARDVRLALPCRHVLEGITKIPPGELHPRYLRSGMDIRAEHHNMTISESEERRLPSYADLMAALAPYASQAP